MKNIKYLLILPLFSIILCGCNQNEENALRIKSGKTTVTISKEYFELTCDKYIQDYQNDFFYGKKEKISNTKLRQICTNNIITEALLKSAIQNNQITVSEAEIKEKESNLSKQYGYKENFRNILKQQNLNDTEINEIFKREIELDKLYKKIKNDKVSLNEIEQFYKKNKDKFNQPEKIRVYQILIKDTSNKDKFIKEIQQKLKQSPANFYSLAKEYSNDETSAKLGGDLGFLSIKDFEEETGKKLFNQKVGTVSEPIKSKQGTHFYYITDKSAKINLPFEKVKNDIETYLYNKKREETLRKLAQNLKNNATIDYYDTKLHPDYVEKGILSKIFK